MTSMRPSTGMPGIGGSGARSSTCGQTSGYTAAALSRRTSGYMGRPLDGGLYEGSGVGAWSKVPSALEEESDMRQFCRICSLRHHCFDYMSEARQVRGTNKEESMGTGKR